MVLEEVDNLQSSWIPFDRYLNLEITKCLIWDLLLQSMGLLERKVIWNIFADCIWNLYQIENFAENSLNDIWL